jgi:hypothetical protein
MSKPCYSVTIENVPNGLLLRLIKRIAKWNRKHRNDRAWLEFHEQDRHKTRTTGQ